jgi:hypothetical protein
MWFRRLISISLSDKQYECFSLEGSQPCRSSKSGTPCDLCTPNKKCKYNEEIIRFLSPTRHDNQSVTHTQLSHLNVIMTLVLTCCSLATNILQQNTGQLLLPTGHLFLTSVKTRGADGRTDGRTKGRTDRPATCVRYQGKFSVRQSAIVIAIQVTRC